jgi:hypothetical protein
MLGNGERKSESLRKRVGEGPGTLRRKKRSEDGFMGGSTGETSRR